MTITTNQPRAPRLIGLDPTAAATTAAAWEAQATDLTASARAIGDIADVASSGFTDALRADAVAFVRAWAGLTVSLAGRCQQQAAALRFAAEGFVAADDASRAEIGRVTASLEAS